MELVYAIGIKERSNSSGAVHLISSSLILNGKYRQGGLMTLLASWIGIDTHGPTSAYIASDSRISWENKEHFDYGKKVFASNRFPEIFGYAGDVLFPSIVLSQILEMIDTKLLFDDAASCAEKNKIIFEKLLYAFSKYPDAYGNNPIQIIHISRDTIVNGYPAFHHYLLTWRKGEGWKQSEKQIPERSDLLQVLGSGGPEFQRNYNGRYQLGDNRSTSRNVFHCFIDTLNSVNDWRCGGPPQLVGIYRKPLTAAQNYGILFNGKRFFLGAEIPKDSFFNQIEWRNEFFELCDGDSKKMLDGATRQIDPLRRK